MKKKILIWTVFLATIPAFAFSLTFTKNLRMNGNLSIIGALAKGSGTFVIDHPLYPLTKLLYHSFVESPDALNIYNGEGTFDNNGELVATLPAYWDALNEKPTYQWTGIGAPTPNVFVKKEIDATSQQFTLAGGTPGTDISWQITGVRHDPYILANPIVNEVTKDDTTPVKSGECLWKPLCN